MTGRRPVLLLLFVLGALVAVIGLRTGIGFHDEGLMLQWGSRVRAGEWPYRDFWSNYLPGQTLLQAAFGPSLLTWRIVRVLTGAAAAIVVFLLVDRVPGARRWALAAWAAAALTLAWPLTPGPTVSATLLALLALLAAPSRSAPAGVLAGLAFVFRPELGVAALLGGLGLRRGDRAEQRHIVVWALIVAAAVLAPFVAVAGGAFWEQTFGFARIQHMQRLPLVSGPHTTDPNKILERMLPVLLLAGTAVWIAQSLWSRRSRAWIPLVVVSALYLLARADEFHVVPLSVVVAGGAGALASLAGRRGELVVPVALVALIVLAGADRNIVKLKQSEPTVAIALPRADGVRTDRATARELVALDRLVRSRTGSGDPILVLPPRTDRVRAGAPLLYTLLDRRNPTRYDVMQPGVVTTAAVQREIARDVARTRPRIVIRWLSPLASATEDNGSARSSGVRILDVAIDNRYRELERVGEFAVLVPR